MLEPNEHRVWMQQTAASSKEFLADFFNDRIISQGLRLPRSPDFTPLNFFLWGYIKDHIFQVEPESNDHLKEFITNVIATIDQNMLKKVFFNMPWHIKLCKEVGGGHIEHLL